MHVSNPQATPAPRYPTLFCVRLLLSSTGQRWVGPTSLPHIWPLILFFWTLHGEKEGPFSLVCFPRCLLPDSDTCRRGDASCFPPLSSCSWDAACTPAAGLVWDERLCSFPQCLSQLLPRRPSSQDPSGQVCVLPSGNWLFLPSAASVPQSWVKGKIFSYERPASPSTPQCW